MAGLQVDVGDQYDDLGHYGEQEDGAHYDHDKIGDGTLDSPRELVDGDPDEYDYDDDDEEDDDDEHGRQTRAARRFDATGRDVGDDDDDDDDDYDDDIDGERGGGGGGDDDDANEPPFDMMLDDENELEFDSGTAALIVSIHKVRVVPRWGRLCACSDRAGSPGVLSGRMIDPWDLHRREEPRHRESTFGAMR